MNPELEKAALDAEEMGCLKETDRAVRARQIIEAPLWQSTFDDMADELTRRAMEAESDEVTKDYKTARKLLLQVKAVFESALETGKLASAQLDVIEEKRKKLGIFERLRRVA
ncbi:hypothetical protein LCGC14_1385290 [marine sediment metagenome]|uniref:Uncharacterized protein n=1 Tax=marine sediment metagenome TaxID=412755 RepID=A0A0F9K1J6_9ZZZZ